MDALGNPIHLHLTPGNIHDVTEAPLLISVASGTNFIADKGYDSNAVVEAIEAKKIFCVNPHLAGLNLGTRPSLVDTRIN